MEINDRKRRLPFWMLVGSHAEKQVAIEGERGRHGGGVTRCKRQ